MAATGVLLMPRYGSCLWWRPIRAGGALALLAMLSACAGAGLGTPQPAARPTAPATAPDPATPAVTAPSVTARPAAAPTVEEVNTECWMRADADRRLRDIDARLAYVNRCVAERAPRR